MHIYRAKATAVNTRKLILTDAVPKQLTFFLPRSCCRNVWWGRFIGDCSSSRRSGQSSTADRQNVDYNDSCQDYDLSAVFMRNWDTRDESGTDKGCEWEKDWEDVQKVCRILDIPCQMVYQFHSVHHSALSDLRTTPSFRN